MQETVKYFRSKVTRNILNFSRREKNVRTGTVLDVWLRGDMESV